MDETQDEVDGYAYYIVHDGLGISHVLRRPKGQLPTTNCRNCSD
ncbi:MAG TPA: hypothetical protein VGR56_01410 [Nitrososphaerales archaeon]|nr:hypothetical protein [Nitrososphaerales archaeon]